jgi:hypothetical protein
MQNLKRPVYRGAETGGQAVKQPACYGMQVTRPTSRRRSVICISSRRPCHHRDGAQTVCDERRIPALMAGTCNDRTLRVDAYQQIAFDPAMVQRRTDICRIATHFRSDKRE